MIRSRIALGMTAVTVWTVPAAAQTATDATPPRTTVAEPAAPDWIATLSGGVLARDGDTAEAYVAAGLSRRVGRGYVRAAATTYRSVTRQVDAVLPSRFLLGSIGAGGTFGMWFVDGYLTAGWQRYGGVTTALGTRPSQLGSGSPVWSGGIGGGRYVALARRLYLTPSAALQYGTNKALRQTFGPTGPQDEETEQRALTGSATVRLDRYFGPTDRHLAGVSISRVQTSNGATALVAGVPGGGGPASPSVRSVADGWFVAGASGSLRLAPRLWLDLGATRSFDAKSGDYTVATLGLRKAF